MQSKRESHIEASSNIGTGFIISYIVQLFIVAPLVYSGFFVLSDPLDAFWVTMIFTVTSYTRSYYWRRYFTKK